MNEYAGLQIFRYALPANRGWRRPWRDLNPRPEYDVIVVGGRGHGLATASTLRRCTGSNVLRFSKRATLEGNVGRNTTIVRSNYMGVRQGVLSIASFFDAD